MTRFGRAGEHPGSCTHTTRRERRSCCAAPEAAHESADGGYEPPRRSGRDSRSSRVDRRRLTWRTGRGEDVPQQAWSKKRERQYEHIKDGLEDRGSRRGRGRGDRRPHREQGAGAQRGGEQASRTSTDDISSSRRGGLRSHRGSRRPDQGAAVRGGQGQERGGPLDDDQGRAGARGRPLTAVARNRGSGMIAA